MKKLSLTLAAFIALWSVTNCGGGVSTVPEPEATPVALAGISLSGTVTMPVTASASISKGISADISKDVVESSVAVNGTVTVELLDGTILAEEDMIEGNFAAVISPDLLDSTSLVIVRAVDILGREEMTMVDNLSGKTTGDVVATSVDVTSTITTQLIYSQGGADCTPDNPARLYAMILSGEIQPVALFNVVKGTIANTDTERDDNASSSLVIMRNVMMKKLADNSPVDFLEVNRFLQNDSAVVSDWQQHYPALVDYDAAAAAGHIQKLIPTVNTIFSDETTRNAAAQLGSAGWGSSAQFIASHGGAELDIMMGKPGIFREFMNSTFTAYNDGDTGALQTMNRSSGRVLTATMANCEESEVSNNVIFAQFNAERDRFSSIDSDFQKYGAAVCNQVKVISADATLMNDVINNAGMFGTFLFDAPDAFASSAATASTVFTAQHNIWIQAPETFAANPMGCTADANCGAGRVCNSMAMCVGECSSNCGFGAKCTTNADCATGHCNFGGSCFLDNEVLGTPTGRVQLLGVGSSCTTGTQCYSGRCFSNACVPAIGGGEIAYGQENSKCLNNTTCNAGLTCTQAGPDYICMANAPGGEPGPTGGEGQHCGPGGVCNQGLTCNQSTICVAGSPPPAPLTATFTPANTAAGVATNGLVKAVFSAAVDAPAGGWAAAFTLKKDNAGASKCAKVAYDANTKTATCYHGALAGNSSYTASVGIPQVILASATFTTGAQTQATWNRSSASATCPGAVKGAGAPGGATVTYLPGYNMYEIVTALPGNPKFQWTLMPGTENTWSATFSGDNPAVPYNSPDPAVTVGASLGATFTLNAASCAVVYIAP